MNYKKLIKKFLEYTKKNYYLPLFFLAILFVGFFAINFIFNTPPRYIYVKVKIGQGLWWANTVKPSQWIVNSINKGDISYDILGKNQAEIISVRKYPTANNNQLDVYLTIRLRINRNNKTESFTFNRSSVSVGSPFEIEFPKTTISGTIMEIQERPFQDKYISKIIYLINQGGYNKDFPYRYDSVQIGDSYFDGEQKVFEVLDKQLEKNIWTISNNLTGSGYEQNIETTQNIIVKAKVLVREIHNDFYYGNEYKLNTNASIPFSTPNFYFEGFLIRKME